MKDKSEMQKAIIIYIEQEYFPIEIGNIPFN
jgi:hypothetical protein